MRLFTPLVLLVGCSGPGGDDAAVDGDPDTDRATDTDGRDTEPTVESDDSDDADDSDGTDDSDVTTDTDTGVPDSDTLETDSSVDTDGLPVDALVTCTLGDACAVAAFEGAFGTYRKDFYFPYGPGTLARGTFGTDAAPTYPEASIADPKNGGRMTVVGRAAVAGALLDRATPRGPWRRAYRVEIDGVDAGELIDQGLLDWVRVGPESFGVGDPIWVMFHSRDAAWDQKATFRVRVPATAGDALDVTLPVRVAEVPLTAVAPTEDLSALRLHLHNDDTVPHTIERVVVDGKDVTAAACLPTPMIAPGQSLMITVPRCTPYVPGDAWTAAVTFTDAETTVGGGRILKPAFPIHAWPVEDDCPFPGISDTRFQAYLDQGYDTLFARRSYGGNAGCSSLDATDAIQSPAFAAAGAWAMPDDFGMTFTDTSRVLTRLLGDEVDNQSLADLVADQEMRRIAENAISWTHEEPDVGTYVGASRHRHTGMFAGAADVQGMDMYVAGCAPHITDWGKHPPLRSSYDYLRATRRNQMPLPTWLYTQGVGSWAGQPTPAEYRVQALSVVAAGAKGLMTFQASLDLGAANPATWAAMRRLHGDLKGIRHLLREGDPTGMARVVSGRGIVESIRVPGGLVVVVIGLETTQAPTDTLCAIGVAVPWRLARQDLDLAVDLPPDVGVTEVFEVLDGQLAAPPGGVWVSGRTLHLDAVSVSDAVAGRLFVVADDPGLRADVLAHLP